MQNYIFWFFCWLWSSLSFAQLGVHGDIMLNTSLALAGLDKDRDFLPSLPCKTQEDYFFPWGWPLGQFPSKFQFGFSLPLKVPIVVGG